VVSGEASVTEGYVPGAAGAAGLARYFVWRWGESRLAPVVRDGLEPQRQLGIDVGSHVSLTVARHHIDARRFVVRGITHDITLPWPWYTTYYLEALPAGGNWLTLGGTADQGIGSSATLAP